MERRLAAILAADVVGYSRLMGNDEAGTLARLEGLKAEILDPLPSTRPSAIRFVHCVLGRRNRILRHWTDLALRSGGGLSWRPSIPRLRTRFRNWLP